MGFNLSTFRCGLTLLDTDLNAIVNAINSIYNAQGIYIDSNSNSIKLTDNSNGNITKSELLTFLGINGNNENNENYIPISGSSNISGWLTPSSNDGCGLGDSSNYWSNVNASETNTKEIKFYAGNAGINTREGDEIIAPLGLIGDPLKASINSEEPEGTSLKKTVLVYDNKILASRDWIKKGFDTLSIYFVHYDEDSRKYINCGGITADVKTDADDNKIPFIEIWSEEDIDTNVSQPIHFINWDTLKGKPSGIKFGENLYGAGDVLTVYDGKIYINDTLYGGGTGGVSVLNDLSNVRASAPGTGLFLMYNGEVWVSSPLPESLIIHPGDVSINEEYYLKYEVDDEHPSGWYSWVERPPGAKKLNELNDVEIDDNLGLGQVLVYSQVTDEEHNTYNSWVNKTLSGSLTYDQSDSDKYLKVKNDGTGTEWSNISLSDLSNTEIGGSNNALSNGLVLVYDSSSTKWKNTSLPANLPSVSGHGNEYLKVNSDGTLAEWTSVTPGSGLLWSDLTNSSANIINPSHLPVPNDTLGGIRATRRTDSISILSPTATNNSKYYRVQVQSDGVAFVDVPWTDSGARTYTSVSGGPTDNQNLTFGGTFKVPYVSLGTNGQISILNRTMTLPSAGSGLTGIKYQNTGGNATEITPSSGYITLKAGTSNVSFNNATTGVLEISVSGSNQNSGSSNRTLENSTTRNNLKSALLQDKSICVMFDNVDSDSNVTSLDYVRISELRYKAKKSLQSSFFFYRGTIDATNNIINPVFYVDLNYKIFLTKVTNTTNDFARINAFNSNNIPIDTYSTWTSAAETAVKGLLLDKYGISCDFSTSTSSGAYSIGTTNRLVQKTVNFYIEQD